ncbi:MAG: LytTR family DNA-binding domain-containing protein [Phycisphaerae bacterium]
MKPLRAIIADDEPLARKRARALLESEPDVEVLCECGDGLATLEAIEAQRPDLVMLDIQMPALDGFQVLAHLRSKQRPAIIFVTAYDQYALRAFDASATDYLLKPYAAARFREAVARVRMQLGDRSVVSNRIDGLLRRYADDAPAPRALCVREGSRWTVVPVVEIEWIEAAGKYAKLHRGKRVHLLRESIQRLAQRLAAARFVRIHRSTLVNADRIAHLEPAFHGDMTVELTNGVTLMLSRAFRESVRQILGMS